MKSAELKSRKRESKSRKNWGNAHRNIWGIDRGVVVLKKEGRLSKQRGGEKEI